MPNVHEPLLINAVCHAAGALIFAIFLFLLWRQRAWAGLEGSALSLAAAVLALLWNAGSLAVLTMSAAPRWHRDMVVTLSFSVLSMLPAVLFHLSLGQRQRPLVIAGYALSLTAVAMHVAETGQPGPEFHEAALRLIPIGFSLLTVVAVAAALRQRGHRKPSLSRLLAAMCLSLFAMSFVHFGVDNVHQAWSSELLFHHAGIPLALFVLLQDYRFVLLDAFVRFLANFLLAAVVTVAVVETAFRLAPADRMTEPLPHAFLLVGICTALIAFALLRGLLQDWLTRVVFRRPDVDLLIETLRAHPQIEGESGYLPWSVRQFGRAMETEAATLVPADKLSARPDAFPVTAAEIPALRSQPGREWVEAAVPLRLGQGDWRAILLGRRRGGRPYLSEDLRTLARLAGVVEERVEKFREMEMQRLVSQAELRALQSQINPHFLFNALNTLYGLIPRSAAGARTTVLHLADIFRYCLQSDQTLIPLHEEVRIVEAYLEIEKLRLGERLTTEIEVQEAVRAARIPILSIQPLVENAVKHGVAASNQPGWVRLKATTDGTRVLIQVENSPAADAHASPPGLGVGLANVRQRLELYYGPEAGLVIDHAAEATSVRFTVPLERS